MRNVFKPARAVAAFTMIVLVWLFVFSGKGMEKSPFPVSTISAMAEIPEGLRIAVASDLHLDPDNTDKSRGASGEVYNPELVDALLWDAKQQGAQILLLTGDLVNGGKLHRHTALTEKLRAAKADGTAVYVLPGNHDLAPIRQSDFAELYADFGYGEAFSRDAASLSYCVLRDDLMILMMDTAGYDASAIDLPDASSAGYSGAFLSEETLIWAEAMLEEAKAGDLPVLCAGHYNLLPPSSREPGGFYLMNGDRFADLLRRYSVPLYLSGHMHILAVYQENGLTELLTEYLLSYPTGYSLLDVTDYGVHYSPRRIDVDTWAVQKSLKDPVLLHHTEWQQETLEQYCAQVVNVMADTKLTEEEKQQASEFFYRTMDAFWHGEITVQRQALEMLPGYGSFFSCADGYSYGWWLRDLFENSSPLSAGFELPWRAE